MVLPDPAITVYGDGFHTSLGQGQQERRVIRTTRIVGCVQPQYRNAVVLDTALV